MKKYTRPEIIESIQSAISDELLKRGIIVSNLVLTEEKAIHSDRHILVLKSDTFQTVPVLFKSIHIASFGSAVKNTKEKTDGVYVYHFWISVHAHHEYFELGTGSVKLFNISGNFTDKNIFGIKIN